MKYFKVHAYVRFYRLDDVEKELKRLGVGGFSYCRVKGMGEYANFYKSDPHVEHARLEVFVRESNLQTVVDSLVEAAATHTKGDGLVAVIPVESMTRIRNHRDMSQSTEELPPRESC
jgi:nitrogen regulatory protein PII